MKKRFVFLLALLLMLLPTAQVFAEGDENKEPYHSCCEYAILARNPDVHGKHVFLSGYLWQPLESGWCVYLSARDWLLDRKENAVWVGDSFSKIDYGISNGYESEESYREKLAEGREIFATLIGYVNLNDRGPGGEYAASIQHEKVTEPYEEEILRKEIAGGETQKDAIEVSVIRLLGDVWRYQNKWVKVFGQWESTHLHGLNEFSALMTDSSSMIISDKNIDDEVLKDSAYILVRFDPTFVTVIGQIAEENEVSGTGSSLLEMGFRKVVDLKAHPLYKKGQKK